MTDLSKLHFSKPTGTPAGCGFGLHSKMETCCREGRLPPGEGAAQRRVRAKMGPHPALRTFSRREKDSPTTWSPYFGKAVVYDRARYLHRNCAFHDRTER